MFQVFRSQNRMNVHVYALFFKVNCPPPQALKDASFSCHIYMQRFDFKNSIISIKWFLNMILNLYLTS